MGLALPETWEPRLAKVRFSDCVAPLGFSHIHSGLKRPAGSGGAKIAEISPSVPSPHGSNVVFARKLPYSASHFELEKRCKHFRRSELRFEGFEDLVQLKAGVLPEDLQDHGLPGRKTGSGSSDAVAGERDSYSPP